VPNFWPDSIVCFDDTGGLFQYQKGPLCKVVADSAMIDHSDDDAASEPLLMFDDEQLHEITLSHLQP